MPAFLIFCMWPSIHAKNSRQDYRCVKLHRFSHDGHKRRMFDVPFAFVLTQRTPLAGASDVRNSIIAFHHPAICHTTGEPSVA
jgi:hypothetical protein